MCLNREFRGIEIEFNDHDAAATRAGQGVGGENHETIGLGDHVASESIERGEVLLTEIFRPRHHAHIMPGDPMDKAVFARPESPRQALRVDTGNNGR